MRGIFSTYPIKTVYVNHFFVTEVAGLLKSLVNHCSFTSFACNIRTLWAQSSHFTDLMYYWTSESHLSYCFYCGVMTRSQGKNVSHWSLERSPGEFCEFCSTSYHRSAMNWLTHKALGKIPSLPRTATRSSGYMPESVCALCFSVQEVKSYAICACACISTIVLGTVLSHFYNDVTPSAQKYYS